MDTVIKSIMGLFFTLLVAFVGVSFILTSINATNADRMLSGYVDEIENSNFAPSVIEACKSDAKEQFGDKDQTEDVLLVNLVHQDGDNERRVVGGNAKLYYKFSIPIMGLFKDNYVEASLR